RSPRDRPPNTPSTAPSAAPAGGRDASGTEQGPRAPAPRPATERLDSGGDGGVLLTGVSAISQSESRPPHPRGSATARDETSQRLPRRRAPPRRPHRGRRPL